MKKLFIALSVLVLCSCSGPRGNRGDGICSQQCAVYASDTSGVQNT